MPERGPAWAMASGVASFSALLMLVLVTYGEVFETRPFEGDNLYILQWADGAGAGDLLRADPDVYPEWRPLAYATVWLQYRWSTIDSIPSYYVVNVLLWTACGWLLHRIVHVLSDSASAGLVAAAIPLTSPRLISSFVLIVDRQSSLACLFGLMAWLIISSAGNRQPWRFGWIAVSVLLVASALSKEYGLAFAAAAAVYAMCDRRRDLAAAAIAALVIYTGLRLGFAAGAVAPYCEDHGYFFVERTVCFSRLDATTGMQAIYNVVATGLGSLLPGLFAGNGAIEITPRRLMMSIVLLAIAVLGWVKGPRPVRMGLLVVGFNTLLSFMLYRSRNQVAALCAVAVGLGVGLPIVWAAIRGIAPSALIRATAIVILLGLLSMRVVVTRERVADRVETSSRPNTCAPGVPNPDRDFMRRVWYKYNMQLSDCPD